MQDIGTTKFEMRGDDKSINFRPSPNFKHMKKYLKSKFEEASCSATAADGQHFTYKDDNRANYLKSKFEEASCSATAADGQQFTYKGDNRANYLKSKFEEASCSATAADDQQFTYKGDNRANYLKSKFEEASCSATAADDQQFTYQGDNRANYLKSKFEEASCSATTADDQQFTYKEDNKANYLKPKFEEASCSATTAHSQQVTYKGDNKANINMAAQPPLPPGTPPPEYPPSFVLKEEVVDHGYEINNAIQQQNNTEDTFSTKTSEEPKKIMCKDFVRGTCKRNPCNYNHELDLTQLKGVYKFCRDFANGKCRRPVCFFVHASTFEKENFFRSGVLPPHTLSHIKDSAVAPQLQPSEAPPQTSKPIYPVASGSSANPAHPEYNSCASLPLAMTVPPAAPVDPAMCHIYREPHQHPPNQNWNEANGIGGNSQEAPTDCVNCKLAEICYKQNLAKLEGIEKSTKKIKEDIAMMDQKKAKLLAILRMLLLQDMPNTL